MTVHILFHVLMKWGWLFSTASPLRERCGCNSVLGKDFILLVKKKLYCFYNISMLGKYLIIVNHLWFIICDLDVFCIRFYLFPCSSTLWYAPYEMCSLNKVWPDWMGWLGWGGVWPDWDEGVFALTGIRGCLTWLNGLTGMRGCWPDWDEGVFDLLTKDVEEY